PNPPADQPTRPATKLSHKMGLLTTGFGGDARPEPPGLEYGLVESAFCWRRLMAGEKPVYRLDDPDTPTPIRAELGDTDQSEWPVAGSDGTPLDPWSRVALLSLVRI